jgi:serine/threonine protein phosphatase PrpC
VTLEYVVQIENAESCQDVAAVVPVDDGIVIALADGAGGTSNGALAAQAVIAAASRPEAAADLSGVLESVDAALSRSGGETTAVLILLTRSLAYGVSVGDSGAWLVHDDGRATELTARQERKPLVGSGAFPVGFAIEWSASATLLVASDGLLRYARMPDIVRVIVDSSSLADAAQSLVELVRLADGGLQDDVSIVLCRDAF